MSPIDDELRAALHGRAQVVTPSPDPLAGIERRARRMQRNRIGAAVAGSALAVAAVAAVVPALQSATAPSDARPPTVASADPTLAPPTLAPPTPAPATTSYALDPDAPWAFRGTAVDEGTRATIQREYATRRQAAEVLVTPLFAQVYEPSQSEEVVFLAEVDGEHRWGVATSTESGPEFLWDAELEPGQRALAAALPGDEVARLLVVAAPEAVSLEYAPGGDAEVREMGELADGVGVVALEGDTSQDDYRVSWPEGTVMTRPAPDLPEAEQPVVDEDPGTGEAPAVPAGLGFDPADPWDYRGPAELTTAPNLAVEDERLFTARHGEGWSTRPLYAAESDAGVSVLFVLRLKDGEPAMVSTTWQVGDGPAGQTDQVVDPGQPLVQASVPTALGDGTRLLVALGSHRAGGIALTGDGGNRPDGIGHPGVGLWAVDAGEDAVVRLYTEGDGVEYAAQPARTS